MVSVIIPTYNGSDKILFSIYSVVKQSYKNIEIIVVDDNGLNSPEQIKTENALKLLIENKIVKYIAHEKNMNGSAARNTGLKHSIGRYIIFLDDDDFMLQRKIEIQKNILEGLSTEYGAVVCGTYFVHKNGKGLTSVPDCNIKNLQKEYLCENVKFNTSAIMFRRSVLEEFSGFDDSFKRHQDWELCFRIMSKYLFANCNELLLIKYATYQNVAKNPEIAVEFFNHFLKKTHVYFKDLSVEDQLVIRNYHYRRLYMGFILNRDFKGAHIFSTNHDFSLKQKVFGFLYFAKILLKRLFVKRKILVKPMESYIQEANNYWLNEFNTIKDSEE